MASPQIPKYQAIYARLRQQILDGEFAAGQKLPPQQELADAFGVTLMTLRQALASLESDGLVWAARGKGTFVVDRPVDISLGNLSSFAAQMQSAGLDLQTELLEVALVAAADKADAGAALDTTGDLCCVVRRRSVGGQPFGLQRSYLDASLGVVDPGAPELGPSLYEAIEGATGWSVASARESVTAVALTVEEANLLDAQAAQPALLSVRTSVNQFGRPFLYDEALLVGDRCTIAADRTSDRLSMQYQVAQDLI